MDNEGVDKPVDDQCSEQSTSGDKKNALPPSMNALKHGIYSLGSLPKGCSYIARITGRYKRALQDALLADKRTPTVADEGLVQTAVRHERHALLCQRWLRVEFDSLTPSERLAYSKEICLATERRDKCIAMLGLKCSAERDPFAGLYDDDAGGDL